MAVLRPSCHYDAMFGSVNLLEFSGMELLLRDLSVKDKYKIVLAEAL